LFSDCKFKTGKQNLYRLYNVGQSAQLKYTIWFMKNVSNNGGNKYQMIIEDQPPYGGLAVTMAKDDPSAAVESASLSDVTNADNQLFSASAHVVMIHSFTVCAKYR
jgi:hypothetical protein